MFSYQIFNMLRKAVLQCLSALSIFFPAPETSYMFEKQNFSYTQQKSCQVHTVQHLLKDRAPESRITTKEGGTNLCLRRIHRYTSPAPPTGQTNMLHLSDVSCLMHLIIPAGQSARFSVEIKVRWRKDMDRLTWN